MSKRKVELFTAGCPVCDEVVKTVEATACRSCEVVIYDLNKGCETNHCRDKAKQYGIKQLPAVAVDGKLLDCCSSASPITSEVLRNAGVGSEL